jgi:hypothetical protein
MTYQITFTNHKSIALPPPLPINPELTCTNMIQKANWQAGDTEGGEFCFPHSCLPITSDHPPLRRVLHDHPPLPSNQVMTWILLCQKNVGFPNACKISSPRAASHLPCCYTPHLVIWSSLVSSMDSTTQQKHWRPLQTLIRTNTKHCLKERCHITIKQEHFLKRKFLPHTHTENYDT